jgi:hypothetical protein
MDEIVACFLSAVSLVPLLPLSAVQCVTVKGFKMFITVAMLTLHRCTWPRQQHCIPPVLSLWMRSVTPYLFTGTKVIANKCILFELIYEMLLVLYIMRNCDILKNISEGNMLVYCRLFSV